MSDLVSLSRATKELKFGGDPRGRKLFRHLCRREQELRTQLIHETEGGQKRVSLVKVRALCPELRGTREHAVREASLELNERVAQEVLVHHSEHTSPILDTLLRKFETLCARVESLEERVAQLESGVEEEIDPKKVEKNANDRNDSRTSAAKDPIVGTFAMETSQNFPKDPILSRKGESCDQGHDDQP